MTDPEGQRISEHATPRPRAVTIALGLSIATYVAAGVTLLARLGPASPPRDTPQTSRWLALAVCIVALALMGGLIAALAFRRRWAWWVWLVLFVGGIAGVWSGLRASLDEGAFGTTRYALLTTVSVAAQVLLLLRSSRQWYGIGHKPGELPPRWSDSPEEP